MTFLKRYGAIAAEFGGCRMTMGAGTATYCRGTEVEI